MDHHRNSGHLNYITFGRRFCLFVLCMLGRFWLNAFPVCHLAGSGRGGESLMHLYSVMVYGMLFAVGSIFKAGPHPA